MTIEAITPQDHMACIAAIQRFAMLVDAARYDEAADLFAVDGVLQRPDERIEGRAALLSSFKARPVQRLTRHILTNVLLEPVSPGQIRAFSYVS
ncbi:nuclear transport factor 2 family protein, partial [Salmonella enterica subsp. enterica serovar 1,4,[5],12:i:-]|nr:nuclear transport factor 2 family protein [Salmonella enterica subsp. enterica serovar 1,4,[5],12:i:-]